MDSWRRHALIGAVTGIAIVSVAACGSSAKPMSTSAALRSSASATPTAIVNQQAASKASVCEPAEAIARRMGVKSLTVYTAVTDPNHLLGRQGEYTSKVEWTVGDEDSGIEVFGGASDARLRYIYLRAFRPPLGDGYDYLYRGAILRLASIYTPAQASALKASFERSCTASP
jgi:hypothetical protein